MKLMQHIDRTVVEDSLNQLEMKHLQKRIEGRPLGTIKAVFCNDRRTVNVKDANGKDSLGDFEAKEIFEGVLHLRESRNTRSHNATAAWEMKEHNVLSVISQMVRVLEYFQYFPPNEVAGRDRCQQRNGE